MKKLIFLFIFSLSIISCKNEPIVYRKVTSNLLHELNGLSESNNIKLPDTSYWVSNSYVTSDSLVYNSKFLLVKDSNIIYLITFGKLDSDTVYSLTIRLEND